MMIRWVLLLGLLSWFVGGCGGGGEQPQDGAVPDGGAGDGGTGVDDYPAYEPLLGAADLDLARWTGASLTEVLRALDLDRSGFADDADLALVDACVAGGATVASDPQCDLTGDGEIDAKDHLLFLRLVGASRARGSGEVASVAAVLAGFADGTLDATAVDAVVPDVTGDGVTDAADYALLAGLLADLPALDLSGDGKVTLADARRLMAGVVGAHFGGPPAGPDLNGDQVVDVTDVMALNAVATFVTAHQAGVLDRNSDGRVDEEDYCLGAAHQLEPNFLRVIMPESAAQAAFGASVPRLLVCRADGRSLFLARQRLDTRLVLRVLPENLYLAPVAQVPSDYSPANAAELAGKQLHVVSTTPGAVRVTALELPWVTDAYDGETDTVGVAVDSGSFGADDYLLLPGAGVPLAGVVPFDAGFKPYSWYRAQAKVRDVVLRDEKPALAALDTELASLKAEVAAVVGSGCPCVLSAAERVALLRSLDQVTQCLDQAERLSGIWFENAVLRHHNLAELQVLTGNDAAMAFDTLSRAFWEHAVSQVQLTLASTLLDCAENGVYRALVTKIFEYALEIYNDSKGDNWLEFDADAFDTAVGHARDALLPDVSTTAVWEGVPEVQKWLAGRTPQQAIQESFETFLKSHPTVPSSAAVGQFFEGLKGQLGEAARDPGLYITALSLMLKFQLEALKANAFAAYFDSVVAAQNLDHSLSEVARWEAAYATAGRLRTEAAQLRDQVAAAFTGAGCETVFGASEVECWSAYQTRVDAAKATLASARDTYLSDRAAAIGEIVDGQGDTCGGMLVALLALGGADVSEAAAGFVDATGGGVACDAPPPAFAGPAGALEDYRDELRDLDAACPVATAHGDALVAPAASTQLQTIDATYAAARAAYDAELAAADSERRQCLEALSTGGGCAHAQDLKDEPFAYLKECLECAAVPVVVCPPADIFTPAADPDGLTRSHTAGGARVVWWAPSLLGYWDPVTGASGSHTMYGTVADGVLTADDSILFYYSSSGGVALANFDPATLNLAGMSVMLIGSTGGDWGGITGGHPDLWTVGNGNTVTVYRGVTDTTNLPAAEYHSLSSGTKVQFVTWVPGAQAAVLMDPTAGNIHVMQDDGTVGDTEAIGQAWRGAGAGTWWLGATNSGMFGGDATVSSAVLYDLSSGAVAVTAVNPNGTGDFWGTDLWTDGTTTVGVAGAGDGFMYFGVDEGSGATCQQWHDTAARVQDVVVDGAHGKLVVSTGDHLQYFDLADVRCTP